MLVDNYVIVILNTRNLGRYATLFLAPAEGWWPSATKWGPFGPPGGPSGPLDKNKYNNSANTNTNTYIAQIEIQLWSKNKYNNRGQIRYVVGVVGVVVVVRNVFIIFRFCPPLVIVNYLL